VACGMPMPAVEDIPPGEQKRFYWNGIDYHIPQGQWCYEEIQLYDELLDIEICYGFDVDGDADNVTGPQHVDDPTCETLTFELLHDEEVLVTVQ
jgi:hypothetical protein